MTPSINLLLEVAGFAFTALCVWLLVKQNIWNWPTAIASAAISAVLFFRAKLYADMGLQFLFIVMALYGWWHWLHPDDRAPGEVKICRMGAAAIATMTAATAFAALAISALLQRFTDSNTPWPDASSSALSLSAQFMQSRKWIANWWLWIAADTIYIGLYIYKGLFLYALLYACLMAMCFSGLAEWRRELEAQEAAGE